MKNLILRYSVFTLGLYVLTFGVVLIIHSALGTSPISSFTYVLSVNTSLTLGTITFFFNMTLIASQFWLIRGGVGNRHDRMEILMQIPFSLLFSLFLDVNMYLTSSISPTSYILSIMLLVSGCIIQALGVVIELKPNVVTMSAEGFVKYACKRYNKDFGRSKVVFDSSLVVLALATSWLMSRSIIGVREGTVMAAILVGLFVSIINANLFRCKHIAHLILRLFRWR